MTALFDSGFPYYSKLKKHTSCVNALAFDKQGRFLASGGDDCDIHLWDFHQEEVDVRGPCHTFIGPRSNIFSLEFSKGNKYLFSGGTDNAIYRYDVASLYANSISPDDRLPKSTFRERDTIRDISCHPFNDEVFLSGSESGRIIQHDLRVPSGSTPTARASDTIQLSSEITGVRYNPTMEHLFVTSESSGRVCLRDARMGFGKRDERRNGGVVLQYNTNLIRLSDGQTCRPEPSSVTFDSEGKKLGVTLLHFYPTIYALSDPDPLAVCSTGPPRPYACPEGTRTNANAGLGQVSQIGSRIHRRGDRLVPAKGYTNSCVIKHGSFGGRSAPISTNVASSSSVPRTRRRPDNTYPHPQAAATLGGDVDYYAGGSDDFCGYVWKIPGVDTLSRTREELSEGVNEDEDEEGSNVDGGGLGVGFLKSQTSSIYKGDYKSLCIPVELSSPCAVLGGHKSIMNMILIHPTFPLILTSGIERHVFVHSPVQSNPFCAELKLCREYDHRDGIEDSDGVHVSEDGDESEVEDEEELYTIQLFDSIIRTEGRADPFETRPWREPEDDDSDEI
ncbi:WD40 repeat-like protein [Dendrothele bispora CBS 962.96]|uniref:WD40 repeat-like protein n=1 Tax=Dendrothele bispora (strain CBS 962.96) TaxID=1314807 RepID=A0A4S8MJM3_DENBC|nr:WD40 repeat-like protein [Dendrothele bispora CBS 962.96]